MSPFVVALFEVAKLVVGAIGEAIAGNNKSALDQALQATRKLNDAIAAEVLKP